MASVKLGVSCRSSEAFQFWTTAGLKLGSVTEILCVLSLIGQTCKGLLKVGDSGRLILFRNVGATAEKVALVANCVTSPLMSRKLRVMGRDMPYPTRRTVLFTPKYGIAQLNPMIGSKPLK